MNTLGAFALPWNPLAWPGLGLNAIGQGKWALGLGFTGLTLVATLSLFAMTLLFAERMYFSGWSRVQTGTKAKKRKPVSGAGETVPTSTHMGWVARWFPTPAWAIILKDARLYRRDIRNLSGLIFPIILAVIWTINIFRDQNAGFSGSARMFFNNSTLGIGIFMAMMFVMRFGFGGFSLEGKQWWILKTSPVRPFHLVLAKYVIALVPPTLFGGIYLVVAALLQKIPLTLLAYQLMAEGIVVGGLAALSLAFGIWGARFDWTNPNEVSGGTVGCVGSLVVMGFVGLACGVLIGLPVLAENLRWSGVAGYGGALFLGLLLSGLGGVLPLAIATRRIPRLGEEESKQGKQRKRGKVGASR